ncbi:hypothetical protein [Pontibacter indicus]|uniref:hypothetical protein n=1 Tax=Pontibacter indicus TaxID=1317125 RepID=UPI0009782ABD|nr:hypothetical protein [Pontibacter indicus]
MKTILDSAYTYYLEGISYRGNGSLQITSVEAFEGQEQLDLQVTEDLKIKGHPLRPTAHSRRFVILFERPVAWQVVDESWCSFDENEIRDTTGALQMIQNSKYFGYVKEQHGWYEHSLGPAKHYRVGTENEIIEVVSCKEPVIEELNTENHSLGT